MVRAIGLVVDNTIIMVENVYRHIKEGMDGFHARQTKALRKLFPYPLFQCGAVHAPIGFMTGLTGALFIEFALHC